MKYEIVSGYFGPLHGGHIDYMKAAKKRGDKLVVIVNNDVQQMLKKGRIIMRETERVKVVMSLRFVDYVVSSLDRDRSVAKTIQHIVDRFGYGHEYEFCNGGDRNQGNVPEAGLCAKLGVKLVDDVGGAKSNSSSNIIKQMKGGKNEI